MITLGAERVIRVVRVGMAVKTLTVPDSGVAGDFVGNDRRRLLIREAIVSFADAFHIAHAVCNSTYYTSLS
jgi:hypothetical protein